MSVLVTINLGRTAADLIAQYGAGSKLYLESAATESGSYGAVTSTLLVSGTERYPIADSSGTPGTTWYRFAPGTSSAVDAAAYSTAWLSTSLTAYATLADLKEVIGDGQSTGHDNLLTDLLGDVSGDIDAACGRRFLRDPQVTGDATVYFDVVRSGMRSLSLATLGANTTDGRPLDIISTTSLWVRTSETAAYVQLTAGTDFVLRAGAMPGVAGVDAPWEDIYLLPGGQFSTWPLGLAAGKHIGPIGCPKVPAVVKRATIDEAHERFRRELGGGPTQAGVSTFGTPIFLDPRAAKALKPPWVKRSYAAI